MLATLWLLAGCREPVVPPDPGGSGRPVVATRTASPAICEKIWLYAADGDWSDASNWLPSGAPASTDDVCFSSGTTGSASYRVTVDSTDLISADSMYVGPGLNLTIDLRADFYLSEEVVVESGATLTIRADTFNLTLGAIINHGTIEVMAARTPGWHGTWIPGGIVNHGSLTFRDRGAFSVRRIENFGLLALDEAVVSADTLINTGDLWASGTGSSFSGAVWVEMKGGRVTGPGILEIDGSSLWSPLFVWTAGSTALRSGSTGRASLSLNNVSLLLGNSVLTGAVDLGGSETPVVTGHIGPSVDLGGTGIVDLRPPASSPLGQAVFIDGALRSWQLISTSPVVVTGVLSTEYVDAPSLENRGELSIENDLLYLGTLRNLGTITGGRLFMSGGLLLAEPGSSVDADVHLSSGGRLQGAASIRAVTVNDGELTPGPGLAILTVGTLTLSPASTVRLEAAAVDRFDRIVVTRAAQLDGVLDVVPIGGFAGGFCGQRISPITAVTPTSPLLGSFASVTGLPSGAAQGWRAHVFGDSVTVAGYDPTRAIAVRPTGALAEGGPALPADVCLGGGRPTSPVVLTPSAARAQLTATPASLTFDGTNYDLPQRLQLLAVDDAVSEGPHGDTLTVRATTTDPGYVNAVAALPMGIADNDPGVDLSVALVSVSRVPVANQTFEVTVRVTNNGPGASTGSSLTVPGLSGATFQNAFGAACTLNGANLQCPLGALAAGGASNVTLVFRAGGTSGVFNNVFRIRGRDWDNVPANDTVPWVLTVN